MLAMWNCEKKIAEAFDDDPRSFINFMLLYGERKKM